MKEKIFDVAICLMVFWIITSLFTGIVVKEGVIGYLIVGAIYGVVLFTVVPLIRFFTLPVKFVSLFLISVMLSVITFFVFNFALPLIDFTDGTIAGLSNSYFTFPAIQLSAMGNVFVGGLISGVFSSILKWLSFGD